MTLVDAHEVEVSLFEGPEHTAVDKAINVLSALPPGDSLVGVTELAQKLSLPKSTVFRALKVLTRHGLVETVAGKYRLGHRLFELGKQVYEPSLLLWEILSPIALQVCERTRESVAIGVLRDDMPVVVGRLPGTAFSAGGAFEMGTAVPAHCTALGKALIAHSPAAAAAAARGLIPKTPHTIVDPARLGVELCAVRSAGLSYDNEEFKNGCSSVAIALLDAAGNPVAAIAVIGRTGRLDVQRAGNALRQSRVEARALLRSFERQNPRTRITNTP